MIVKAFGHVRPEGPYPLEPRLDHRPHRIEEIEPRLDRRIAPNRAGQKEEGVSVGHGYSRAGIVPGRM